MADKNTPVKSFQMDNVRVSVWENTRENGDDQEYVTQSVTLNRGYKNAKGDWQNTGSLRKNDIPKAMLALQQAYEFMCKREN